MAFDDITLPLSISYGSAAGPAFSTEIITIDNGYERRNQNWSQARRVYDARTGIRSSDDAAMLYHFFIARAGRARGFRLRDPFDHSSALDGQSAPTAFDQYCATGDGTTLQFQLIKTYSSGSISSVRAIKKPVTDTLSIGINGLSVTSGWSVDTTTGLITFATPPSPGSTITTGFLFDVPVRFDTDELTMTFDNHILSKAAIPIVEVRL